MLLIAILVVWRWHITALMRWLLTSVCVCGVPLAERLAESLRLSQIPSLMMQVFLCFRVLILRMSPQHLTSLWPTIITEMVSHSAVGPPLTQSGQIWIIIIHKYFMALFPTERAQCACSHTCTCTIYIYWHTHNHIILITYWINCSNIKQVFVEQQTK